MVKGCICVCVSVVGNGFILIRIFVMSAIEQNLERQPCFLFIFLFKICKSVHHRTIQINHQPDATIFQFIILTFIYTSTCFGRFPARHQELNDCSGSLWFYLRIVAIVVLCSWSGRPARPRTQHD